MPKAIPKRVKLGYALYVKRPSPGANALPNGYERVGFLFDSSREAADWRERNYPSVTKWSVQAVRVSAEKLEVRA